MRKLGYEELLEQRLSEEGALKVERHPVVGVLEDIRSLYNVGSCFRTADAMLLRELILTGYTPVPPRKEISKTALGADRSVPWRHFSDPTEALRALRDEGYHILALELTETAVPFDRLETVDPFPDRVALVAGNEIKGVREESLELCHGSVSIPMYGVKHSLNVAVAFGIGVWELIRHVRHLQETRHPT